MKNSFAAAGIFALGLAATWLPSSGAKADPITDTFTMSLAGTAVANGSFTYDSSIVGDVTYSDLTAFQVTLGPSGTPYTLSFVLSATDYVYFLLDPTAVAFVPGTATGFDGSFPELLGACHRALSNENGRSAARQGVNAFGCLDRRRNSYRLAAAPPRDLSTTKKAPTAGIERAKLDL